MKKLIVAIVVLLALPIGLKATYAADEPETEYEVTISVTYNAVSIEEANKIISDVLERHKTACKTEARAKKVGDTPDISCGTWSVMIPSSVSTEE